MKKSSLYEALNAMKDARPEVSVRALAERAKVSKQAAHKWFQTGRVSEKNLRVVAEMYGADHVELTIHKRYVPIEQGNTRRVSATAHDVPLIEWNSISDGVREPHQREALRVVSTTIKISPRSFAVELKDDSMQSPTGESFPEGAYLIVDPGRTAQHGNKVLARPTKAAAVTCKQLIEDGEKHYLKPLNPRYPIIELQDDGEIIGVVVQMVFDVN